LLVAVPECLCQTGKVTLRSVTVGGRGGKTQMSVLVGWFFRVCLLCALDCVRNRA
jgi:hypothetical protein